MASIELKAQRTVEILDQGRKVQLVFGPITAQQWLDYFNRIESSSVNEGGKRIDRLDSTAARTHLVNKTLVDAKGYQTADGAPIATIANWQDMLPISHRLAAGETLVDIERGKLSDDQPFVLGAESIYLNAVWGSERFTGLCHRFRTATVEQQRRLARASSRSVVVGGSRRGETRWIGAQPVLAELYDELIVSVEGYTVDGKELGSDRAAIVANMDTFHKVAAADFLFAPAEASIPDEKNPSSEEQ
ncbi:MAG: hypothetical protein P4K83_02090 [Terracidiphilus sp.]|nr:hypothetical protein [Terracidiphilus sp.]